MQREQEGVGRAVFGTSYLKRRSGASTRSLDEPDEDERRGQVRERAMVCVIKGHRDGFPTVDLRESFVRPEVLETEKNRCRSLRPRTHIFYARVYIDTYSTVTYTVAELQKYSRRVHHPQ